MEKALAIALDGSLARRKEIVEQVIVLSPRNFALLTATAERLGRERDEAREVVEVITLFLRDVMLYRYGSGSLVNADMESLVAQTAGALSPRGIRERLEAATRAGQSLLRNINPRLTLEVLFMSLAMEK